MGDVLKPLENPGDLAAHELHVRHHGGAPAGHECRAAPEYGTVGPFWSAVGRRTLVRRSADATGPVFEGHWRRVRIMRSMWKGAISFGLVTIPVKVYPATEQRGRHSP
jgi:hypothetical protein